MGFADKQAMTRLKLAALLLVVVSAITTVTACSARAYRATSGAFCAVNVYRLYRDYQHHHIGWAAFEGVVAAHNCHQAFRR